MVILSLLEDGIPRLPRIAGRPVWQQKKCPISKSPVDIINQRVLAILAKVGLGAGIGALQNGLSGAAVGAGMGALAQYR